MRNYIATTGRQLASVALRFRNPWERQAGDAWSNPTTTTLGQFGRGIGTESRDDGSRRTRLEAVLFLANEPLTSRKLAQLASLEDGTQARTLIGQLNKTYDASARAFRVEEVAGGYQLRTRPEFSRWIRRMVGAPPEIRMSGPSLETLAVVAYRQPVLRTEIEAIRGVQCGEILRQLMERGMVRIAGRADELGRPFLYGTTRNFLQVFGLRSLDELPRASMLRKPEADQNEQTLDQQLEETDQDEYQDDDEFEDDEEDDDDSDEDDIDDDEE
ncbi:MAG: SMC-Scp complex subunit ScpB [Planctomycetota bacterium]|nr:SMC-Scp complex subunit ScpB [Planctomycetota bacterium]